MKLFIFGHAYTLHSVRRYILKNHSDIDFETGEADITNPSKMLKQIQQIETDFDGILFTGRIPYDILLSHMIPQKPWTYIKRQESQILSVLLKASIKHYDIYKLAIDSPSLAAFDPRIMERIFHSIAAKPSQLQIVHINVDPMDSNLIETLVAEHKRAYQTKKASFCITSISPVYEKLSAENVPVFRIDFDDNAIENAIIHLRMLHLQRSQSQTEITMAMIEIYDQAEGCDGSYRQKSSLYNRLSVIEEVVELSNSLNGALIEISNSQFCLVFYDQNNHIGQSNNFCYHHVPHLVRYAQQKNVKVHIGIGIHPTPSLCRQYALRALELARNIKNSSAFLCDVSGRCYGPLYPASQSDHTTSPVFYTDDLAWNVSVKTGIHIGTIEQLLKMKTDQNGEFSSHDLAAALGISSRNANRLITVLEEQNIIEVAGKKVYPGGGRPLRIFRITI